MRSCSLFSLKQRGIHFEVYAVALLWRRLRSRLLAPRFFPAMRVSPRRFSFALLILCLLGSLGSAGGAEFYSTEPGPAGVVRVARPTLVWRIFPTPGTIVSAGLMSINEIVVQPAYSAEWGALYFTPPEPLPPGPYQVRCRVKVEDRQLIAEKETEWSFRVAEDAVASLPPPSTSQREALEAANALRRKLSLPLLSLDVRLCASSLSHSSYLQKNRASGHTQTPGKPGFTGVEPHQRMQAFNYPGLKTGENVAQAPVERNTILEATRRLFDAPYHRKPFMDPGLEDFGAGVLGNYTTLNFGSLRPLYSGPPRIVLYPLPNQKDVPTTFEGNEIPDPLRTHGAKTPCGYILTYFLFAAGNPIIRVTGARLTTAEGTPVPFFLNAPANDDQLTNGAFLIPQEPLEPGTRYTATIQAFTANGINLSRIWSFTTAKEEKAPAPAAPNQ